MSQKTDPTSLRLQKTNKHFSSSWYSDYFYSQMTVDDLQIRSYVEGLSEQIGRSQMFPYTQRYYKRVYTYLFFFDAREIRNQREKVLRLSLRGRRNAASTAASIAFLHSCFGFVLKESNPVGATLAVETQRKNQVQISNRKAKTPYSYWWKESLKQLPYFQFGFNQTLFMGLTLNCSVIRDLVVQNCNRSNKNTKSLAICSIKKCAGKKDVLPTLCGTNARYSPSKQNKQHLYPGLLKNSGKTSIEMTKLTQSLQDTRVVDLSVLYLHPFHNLCAVAQVDLKQRAVRSTQESTVHAFVRSTKASTSALNIFHGTMEAAFLSTYLFSNCLAKTGHQEHLKATNSCFLSPKTSQYSSYVSTLLESHAEHIHAYPYCISDLHSWYAYCSTKKVKMIAHSTSTSIYPIRVVQDIQSAAFLAQEIAYLLQKGASFKQVQTRILSEHTKNEIVKGVRLSCSGRIGGRSKKAQKSKIQSVQWGETSLHVLSSKLSFASKSVNTPFGKIGIKLWLCFQ